MKVETGKMNLKELVNHKIYNAPLSDVKIESKRIINTINPHSYCLAKKDSIFEKALSDSDVLLPDGIGIVLAAKILSNKKIKKISGTNMHRFLLDQANEKNQKIFYLGSSVRTLDLIMQKIEEDFPRIKVGSYSPPFRQVFTVEESNAMISAINTFNPDILFVGMTAPKQEKWVFSNKDRIKANTILSIGAVFDFYAGTIKRPGKIWIKLGLEWLPRLFREPKRLWRRNFISSPLFLWYLLKEKLG